MTKRNITDAEKIFYEQRDELLKKVDSKYVADAPFLFSHRVALGGILTRVELFKMMLHKPGAIIECGVYRGNSLMLLHHLSVLLEPYAINRAMFGFDTFEGFRSINSKSDPGDISENNFSDTSFDLLRQSIELADITRPVNKIPRCELIKGDIVETVPKFVAEKRDLVVSLLILDTDLYEPTRVALLNFLPHMHKGAIVALDEVCYRHFAGETIALKEAIDIRSVELKKFPFESCLGYFVVD
jgi:hypothetical protein